MYKFLLSESGLQRIIASFCNPLKVFFSTCLSGLLILITSTISASQAPDIPAYSYDNFTSIGSTLYFTASKLSGKEGGILWKSDGTAAGTVRLKTVAAHRLTVVNGTLYFTANETNTGYELWKSNGTPEGTIKIKEVPLQIPDYYEGYHRMPIQLITTNNLLYFTSNNGLHEYELWRTDGTPAGTIKVTSVGLITYDTAIATNFTSVGDVLYFDALGGIRKTDGTPEGTVVLINAQSDPYYQSIELLEQANGTVYLNNGQNGLWKTDGTAAGTLPVYKWPYGTIILTNIPFEKASIGIENTFYFLTVTIKQYPLPEDYALWKSDGTEAGTVKLKEFKSLIASITTVGSRLYFTAIEGGNGEELWTSDGTTAGTIKLKSINSYLGSASPTAGNGTLFFRVHNDFPDDIWKSDGTEAGTVLVKDIHPGNTSQVNNLTNVKGTLYFSAKAYPNSTIESLWKSDGTEAGTQRVFDVIGPAVSCSGTGSILQEKWLKVAGHSVSAIPLNTSPTSSAQLTSFETKLNQGDNYGERIRGYLCAPYTGSYLFYLAGDDQAELYLSSDEDPAKKTRIASLTSYTGNKEWRKYPSQQSTLISLIAGKKYYIEALHKEAAGGDHLAIGWQTPASYLLEVIPGSFLSPFIASCPTTAQSSQVINPSSGSILSGTSLYLKTIPGASSYTLQVSTSADFTTGVITKTTSSRLSTGTYYASFPELALNQRYYVRVYTNLGLCWGPVTSFTTASAAGSAYVVNPSDGGTTTSTSLYLNTVSGATTYTLQVSTSADFTSNVLTRATVSRLSTGTYYALFPELILNQKYYVRVKTNLSELWGRTTSFTRVSAVARLAAEALTESLENRVSVYPNPFKDKLTIVSAQAGKLYITIADNLGRIVHQTTTQGAQTELNLAHLKQGVYVVKVLTEDGSTQVLRAIKQ
ncbi:T9SS type A sorting domain-containing protein [Rhodocytophaga rosea]|uniref:T9SS type A sorting domain-containing protein n=1 Tax=Rhodocytophaga rosea TaxID=2704465 RepID=A0A6C0GSG6_9BACT|nr:T9SS type A sorting domain-containing protein [Rhodocytophaga rosea]QHT70897.1 T9SS type A sorting domain-containing protein [Rhodocytophaga rosea]